VLSEITQIIQVDLDLKYKSNIRDLFDEFDNFAEGAVIGIAREMQPVYRYSSLPEESRGGQRVAGVSRHQLKSVWRKASGEATPCFDPCGGTESETYRSV